MFIEFSDGEIEAILKGLSNNYVKWSHNDTIITATKSAIKKIKDKMKN